MQFPDFSHGDKPNQQGSAPKVDFLAIALDRITRIVPGWGEGLSSPVPSEELLKLASEEVRASAIHSLRMIITREHNAQYSRVISVGELNKEGVYDAAVGFEEREQSLHIKDIGSLIKGEGRKLIAQVAFLAIEKGKCVTLCSLKEEGLIDYYKSLGFYDNLDDLFVLEGAALVELASEYKSE